MSKKGFGKFLMGAALIGSVAALITYVKQSHSKEDLRDDFDDFDDELNEELFDHETTSKESDDRHYVTIPLDRTAEENVNKADTESVSTTPSPEQKATTTPSVELEVEQVESDIEQDIHAFNLEDETTE